MEGTKESFVTTEVSTDYNYRQKNTTDVEKLTAYCVWNSSYSLDCIMEARATLA